MSATPPVLVTGTAAVTSCGVGTLPFWERVAQRGSPHAPPPSGRFPPRPFAPENRLPGYVLAALEHDLGSLLHALSDDEKEGVGVALGSLYGYLGPYLTYLQVATEEGYQLVNPRHFPWTLPNSSAVSVSDAFGLWGSSTALATGLSAGLEAIAYGAEAIRRGEEHTMLAGACEEINPATAATAQPPESPAAEGVGILLLQSSEAATAHARRPLARCCAVATRQGMSWDDPLSGDRAAAVIRDAVRASDLDLRDVTAVFPSGGGRGSGDRFETELFERLFGGVSPTPEVLAIKPFTGACLAAAGALQCVAAVHCLAAGAHDAALVYAAGSDGSFGTAILRSAA